MPKLPALGSEKNPPTTEVTLGTIHKVRTHRGGGGEGTQKRT